MKTTARPQTRKTETIRLPEASPGTHRQLDIVHYGTPGQGPKAYLQAALHADEIPGLLVLHKLIRLLNTADSKGNIEGHIVVVPIANPIGSSQHYLGELAGRYDQSSGINFNRGYPDLADAIAERVGSQLGEQAEQNTRLIRAAALQFLDEQHPLDPVQVLKHSLMKHAVDADIALDLHCDWQSVLHIYTGTPIWPRARKLAAYLGVEVSLLATVSGGNPFDEALSGLWWELAEKFPDKAIESACVAATIELRGKSDVQEAQAESDATGIFHYLQDSGLISGRAPEAPALINNATPLDGVEKIIAPYAGVVSYNRKPGDKVYPGEVVCTLFDIGQYDGPAGRLELTASIEGILYARRLDRLARPGQTLCRISGQNPIAEDSGNLLEN